MTAASGWPACFTRLKRLSIDLVRPPFVSDSFMFSIAHTHASARHWRMRIEQVSKDAGTYCRRFTKLPLREKKEIERELTQGTGHCPDAGHGYVRSQTHYAESKWQTMTF